MKKVLLVFVSMTFLVGCQSPTSSETRTPMKLDIIYRGTDRVPLHQAIQLEVDTGLSGFIPEVTWQSTNPEIITVSSTGVVTPVAVGEAIIKASLKSNPSIKDELELSAYCLVESLEFLSNKAPLYEPLTTYTPTRFKENTWTITENELSEGVNLNLVNLQLNNGRPVTAHVLEIDLSKDVDIVAGSYNDLTSATGKKQNLYGQIKAYESNHSDKKVIGATNADFFGNFPVNAFVKDNVIVKDAHLDNGGYDYTNTNNDIPASMPMLFGVHDSFAQVGAIVDEKTVQETIQSKLVYHAKAISKTGEKIDEWDNIQRNNFSAPDYQRVNLITSMSRDAKAPANATVYTIKPHEEGYVAHGEIIQIDQVTTLTSYPGLPGYIRLVVPQSESMTTLNIGDFIAYHIGSEDGKWDYYQQIIGARQELVHNGRIPSTVTLENTNGAQSTNIPRTAIGIKEDGRVALFAIESLYYGKNTAKAGDTYGVNLPELAEIMRYYGCVNAGNFDGGGSTQMIVSRDGVDEVVVRSSDYGTSNLEDGRLIINSVLIVESKNPS